MNRLGMIALAVFVAWILTFGAGWYYGSQRAATQRSEETSVISSLETGRARVLEGRIELYNNNFGNAARHFDEGKRELGQAVTLLERDSQTDQVNQVRQAVTAIDAAIQRSGRLEPAAHESATTAQKALDAVISQRRAIR